MTKQTKLTAINPANEREIEVMFGKAVCAYANAQETFKLPYTDGRFRHVPQDEVVAAMRSEHEATVRCLDLFVKENLYEIQDIVKASAIEMMER